LLLDRFMTSQPKLVEFISLMALLTALTAMSIDAILPGLMDIRTEFQIEDVASTQLIVSLFVLGMVFGEIVFGPLADAKGRKYSIQLGLVIFGVGSLVAMFATNLEMVLVGRIVQGFGVAAPKVVSRSIIRDLYRGDAMARVGSLVMSVMILTPMIAPLVGQTVLFAGTWRWVFGLFLLHAVIASLWLAFRQPETLTPEKQLPINMGELWRNAVAILSNSRVIMATFASGLMFGAILVYVSLSQDIFVTLYDKGVWFPVWFGLLALPASLSALLNARIVMRFGMRRITNWGFWGVAVCSAMLVISTVIENGVPPFWVFFTLCFFNAFCFGSVFGNISAISMEWLGRVAGLGSSIIASVSSLVAVLVSIPIGRLYDGSVMPVAIAYLLAGLGGLILLWIGDRKAGVDV